MVKVSGVKVQFLFLKEKTSYEMRISDWRSDVCSSDLSFSTRMAVKTGGRIVDAFDDGDTARMTGGRIGRVNMKLADNLFDMSGGVIDRNLVAGFGNDTIILSDGTIGGNISVSGGTDSVTITGGTVGGDVLLSVGTDSFVWDGGGVVHGMVDMGGDDDSARLENGRAQV